jgi:hypothetical protein
MGGFGSGSWIRQWRRLTTDELPSLDIREMRRTGWLVPGQVGVTRWRRGDRETVPVRFEILGFREFASEVRLSYRVSSERIDYLVHVSWSPCNFGGQRPWWICPGIDCGRRVAVIYGNRYFLCRHCHDLAYQSTREPTHALKLRKAQKSIQQMGGSGSILNPLPGKPRGMHHRTYRRLWRESYLATMEYWRSYDVWLLRTLERITCE